MDDYDEKENLKEKTNGDVRFYSSKIELYFLASTKVIFARKRTLLKDTIKLIIDVIKAFRHIR